MHVRLIIWEGVVGVLLCLWCAYDLDSPVPLAALFIAPPATALIVWRYSRRGKPTIRRTSAAGFILAALVLCLVSWIAAGNARLGVRRARDMSQKILPHDAYYYLSKPNNVATQPAE
jgi:hypothetical protein